MSIKFTDVICIYKIYIYILCDVHIFNIYCVMYIYNIYCVMYQAWLPYDI